MFVLKLYGFCLSIAYIARRRHPYIQSLATLIIIPEKDITRLLVLILFISDFVSDPKIIIIIKYPQHFKGKKYFIGELILLIGYYYIS